MHSPCSVIPAKGGLCKTAISVIPGLTWNLVRSSVYLVGRDSSFRWNDELSRSRGYASVPHSEIPAASAGMTESRSGDCKDMLNTNTLLKRNRRPQRQHQRHRSYRRNRNPLQVAPHIVKIMHRRRRPRPPILTLRPRRTRTPALGRRARKLRASPHLHIAPHRSIRRRIRRSGLRRWQTVGLCAPAALSPRRLLRPVRPAPSAS